MQLELGLNIAASLTPQIPLIGGKSDPFAAFSSANPTIQYKCDEASGNLLDSIGTRHLTAVNAPGSTTGRVGLARSFDGTNYFSATADATAQAINQDFSISVWFRLGTLAGMQQIVSCRNAGSGDGKVNYIIRSETTSLVLYIGRGNIATLNNFTIGTVAANTTYHVAVSFNATTKAIRGVFNGGAAASIGTSTVSPDTDNATAKLAVGGDVRALASSGTWIDAAQIWIGTVLPDADLALLGSSPHEF